MKNSCFTLITCALLYSCSNPESRLPADPEERFLFDKRDVIEEGVSDIYVNYTYPSYAFVSRYYVEKWGRYSRSVCGIYRTKEKRTNDRDFYFIFTDWDGEYYSSRYSTPDKDSEWRKYCMDRVKNGAGRDFQIDFPKPKSGFSFSGGGDSEKDKIREIIIGQPKP